jgi:hypothetical protein
VRPVACCGAPGRVLPALLLGAAPARRGSRRGGRRGVRTRSSTPRPS